MFFTCCCCMRLVGWFNRICSLSQDPHRRPRAIYLIRDSTQMLKVRFCLLLSRHFIDFPFGSGVSGPPFIFLLAFRCAAKKPHAREPFPCPGTCSGVKFIFIFTSTITICEPSSDLSFTLIITLFCPSLACSVQIKLSISVNGQRERDVGKKEQGIPY